MSNGLSRYRACAERGASGGNLSPRFRNGRLEGANRANGTAAHDAGWQQFCRYTLDLIGEVTLASRLRIGHPDRLEGIRAFRSGAS